MTQAGATPPGPDRRRQGSGDLAEAFAKADGRRLAIATAGALIVAAVILVAAVLPAEFGRDPLGTGKALGLLDLYAGAAEPSPPPSAPPSATLPMTMYKVDSVTFALRPS